MQGTGSKALYYKNTDKKWQDFKIIQEYRQKNDSIFLKSQVRELVINGLFIADES